jgi:hypothetical protein
MGESDARLKADIISIVEGIRVSDIEKEAPGCRGILTVHEDPGSGKNKFSFLR